LYLHKQQGPQQWSENYIKRTTLGGRIMHRLLHYTLQHARTSVGFRVFNIMTQELALYTVCGHD
jgi:hypothetical protein